MNTRDQQIAIAIAIGKPETESPLWGGHGTNPEFRNYLSDLNAMHEAEEWIFKLEDERGVIDIFEEYERQLLEIIDRDQNVFALHASARQRAEAFLKTIGKWK